MALTPTRLDFRLRLSHVDRGIELGADKEVSVVVARHPSETQEHAILRVLSWCLLYEPDLELGPGLSTPEAADLWTRDATGRLTTWVECGNAPADRLRKVLQHNHGVALHVVFDDPRRAETLREELPSDRLPRGAKPLTIWTIEHTLVQELAAREERRQTWAVTIVGDSFYIDTHGQNLVGAATRSEIESPQR
jgi:uncharacterized protein YaeQ